MTILINKGIYKFTMKQTTNTVKFFGILFITIYFFLYIIPFPLEWIPFHVGETISDVVDSFWQWLVLIIAKDVIRYPGEITTRVNGSGDTIFHFFKLLVQGGTSFLVTFLLLVLDRNKRLFNRIKLLAPVYFRYFLAFTLLSYGLAKVFPNQFWEPGLTDLLKPFGDISPMGLLWKFMGYSVPYIVFTGVLEVLAGTLILFRKTSKLGAILAFGIMLNVFVLNMCYDVPVKLFSFHLIVLSIIVLARDIKGVIDFFILNRPVNASEFKPYFKGKKYVRFGSIIKGLFILFAVSILISNNYKNQWKHGRKAQMPYLYGIYEVENFIVNGDTILPLLTDKYRWRRLVIDKFSSNITMMNGNLLYVSSDVDTVNSTIQIKPYREESTYNFKYKLSDSVLVFNGLRDNDSLTIEFILRDVSEFYLNKRGFHWINEFPNNR